MPVSLSIMLVTRGACDVRAALAQCVYDAYDDQGGTEPEEVDVQASLEIVWSRPLKVGDGRAIHRAVFTPPTPDGGSDAEAAALVQNFAEHARKLADAANPGVAHVVHFASGAQLEGHARLYREIYLIEMRLREVLTYIFLDEFPDRAYEFLEGNKVALQGDGSTHTPEYLAAHGENQLFHCLFDDYDNLNQNPVAKPTDLLPLIRDSQTYDKLREAVKDAPIKKERHALFIAALKAIVPDIEAVRNAVAHNRDLPSRAEQKYEEARKKLDDALAEFWRAEIDEVTLPPGILDPVVVEPDPSAPPAPADADLGGAQHPPHLPG